MQTQGSSKFTLLQTYHIHTLRLDLKQQQDQTVITRYMQFDTCEDMVQKDRLLKNSNFLNISNSLKNQEVYPQECLIINNLTYKMSVFPQLFSDSENQQQTRHPKTLLKKKHIEKAKRRLKQEALNSRIAELQKKLQDGKKQFQEMQKELTQTIDQFKSEKTGLISQYEEQIKNLKSHANQQEQLRNQYAQKIELLNQLYQRQNLKNYEKDRKIRHLQQEIKHQRALNNELDELCDKLKQEKMQYLRNINQRNQTFWNHGN